MSRQISAKDVLKLAWPDFLIQLIIVVASVVEMFFIGKSGIVAVVSVTIGNIISSLIGNFFGECEAASKSLSAKYFGEQSQLNIKKTFLVSLIIPLFIGLLIFFASPLISFLTFYFVGSVDVNQAGIVYLDTLLKAVPFSLMLYSLTGFINGIGDMTSPLYIRVLMHLVNVFLDFVLLFGVWGFPKLGVRGVAISWICTYFLGSLLSVFVIFKRKYVDAKFNFMIFKETFWDNIDVLKTYLQISCNVGFQYGFCDLAMYILALIIERLGVNALAVHQIAYYQIYASLQLFTYGFYDACLIVVGKLIGAKEYPDIVPNTIKICKIVFFLSLLCVLGVFWGAPFWISLFSPLNSDVAQMSSFVVKLLCFNLIIDSLYNVIIGGLLGADDSKFVMMEGVFAEYVILLPLSYVLTSIFGMGLVGIYFAYCIRTFFNLLVVGWRFFVFREWNKIDLDKKRSFIVLPAYLQNYSIPIGVQYLIDDDIFVPNYGYFGEQSFLNKLNKN